MNNLYKPIFLSMIAALAVPPAQAAIQTFTDEQAFNLAISGKPVVSESFESIAWEPTRTTGIAAPIISQGLTWSAGDKLRTVISPFARTGEYAVIDSFGSPDLIWVTSPTLLYAVSGWFVVTDGINLSISLDSGVAIPVSHPQRQSFFGVVKTEGFSYFSVSTTAGNFGADDFTIATVTTVPEPMSLLLLLAGLAGITVKLQRHDA